jgi:hypothetical protein
MNAYSLLFEAGEANQPDVAKVPGLAVVPLPGVHPGPSKFRKYGNEVIG